VVDDDTALYCKFLDNINLKVEVPRQPNYEIKYLGLRLGQGIRKSSECRVDWV